MGHESDGLTVRLRLFLLTMRSLLQLKKQQQLQQEILLQHFQQQRQQLAEQHEQQLRHHLKVNITSDTRLARRGGLAV